METNAHDSAKTSDQGYSSGLAISISPKALNRIQYHKWTLAKAVQELLGPLRGGIPEGIGDERLLQIPMVTARTARYFLHLADDALEDRTLQETSSLNVIAKDNDQAAASGAKGG